MPESEHSLETEFCFFRRPVCDYDVQKLFSMGLMSLYKICKSREIMKAQIKRN